MSRYIHTVSYISSSPMMPFYTVSNGYNYLRTPGFKALVSVESAKIVELNGNNFAAFFAFACCAAYENAVDSYRYAQESKALAASREGRAVMRSFARQNGFDFHAWK